MPDQATTVAALVEAVQRAVVYTFRSGTYGIRVQQVDLDIGLVLTEGVGGEVKWQVLTFGETLGDRQTQTLRLTWTHADLKGFVQPRQDVSDDLIRGLDAADIGVRAWNTAGLPLAFSAGRLSFELAVSQSGQLSVATLTASAGQKETHTVTLNFGAA